MGARTGRARGSRADRVSTTDQDTATQQAKLREAGWTLVRIEKVSERSRDGRSELEAVMAFSRPGDAPVVVKLDRRVAEPDFCPPTMAGRGGSATSDIPRRRGNGQVDPELPLRSVYERPGSARKRLRPWAEVWHSRSSGILDTYKKRDGPSLRF